MSSEEWRKKNLIEIEFIQLIFCGFSDKSEKPVHRKFLHLSDWNKRRRRCYSLDCIRLSREKGRKRVKKNETKRTTQRSRVVKSGIGKERARTNMQSTMLELSVRLCKYAMCIMHTVKCVLNIPFLSSLVALIFWFLHLLGNMCFFSSFFYIVAITFYCIFHFII